MGTGKRTLSHRVFATVFTVAMAVILLFTVAGAFFIQRALSGSTSDKLQNEAEIIAQALNAASDDYDFLNRLNREDVRVTLIAQNGRVLFDNETSPSMLSNHKNRPEVRDALKTGTGASERSSSTLGEVMLYHAVRLDDGSVVRLAQSQAGVLNILISLVWPLLGIAGACALICFIAARREARAIIAPLRDVDLDHPHRSSEAAYAEMVPMLERIESQRQELKRQMRVLADNDRMRREFTANVTHELKTPLTAISGYAELISSGMVADEDDLRDFGGRIYREAGRLAALVNDILTLSNIEEAERAEQDMSHGSPSALGSTEPIELARLIDSVCARLEQVAHDNSVTISAAGEPAIVVGVPRLVDGLVYNLASNAIRYNKPAGTVSLSCGTDDAGRPYVRVADTGIGIAPEEQEKVFERFYRVDKSRSKARGGTGLGLAIVKHAAAFHHATVDLRSELGEGTTVTVRFPAAPPLEG